MRSTPLARVFLTGATGTVARGVMAALAESGDYAVTALVRQSADLAMLAGWGAQGVVGDMTDRRCFERLRTTHHFEFIIHTAQASYRTNPQEEIDRAERRAVENLERLATAVTRLMVFTGGVWSYGTGAGGGHINAQTPMHPFPSARERARLVRELLARRSYPWLILDPPSLVYGASGPLQALAQALRAGAEVDVLDDRRVLWSVIEQLDLGRAYGALLQHGQAGDSFVVAEDDPVGVVEYYEAVARQIGCGKILLHPATHLDRANHDDWVRRRTSQPVDSTHLRARTGWLPRERFATSFVRFLS